MYASPYKFIMINAFDKNMPIRDMIMTFIPVATLILLHTYFTF